MMEIDLVYMWVDGNDPAWQAKKRAYSGEQTLVQADAVGDCRFIDNDELKYSLRSVERFAPWIRHIYIVTDGQRPAWLDESNPRVSVVEHAQIVPADRLPLFNSNALEYFLADIPGLAEHFLYANDDMFFCAPVDPGFFFDAQGRPIVRLKTQSLKRHLDQLYPYKVYSAQQEIERRYGKKYTLAPHHNIDAYRRSDFIAVREEFPEQIDRTTRSRFREREDLQRSAILYCALARGEAVARKVTRFNRVKGVWGYLCAAFGGKCGADSRCIPVTARDPEAILAKYRPVLLCMNDGEHTTDNDRRRAREFLERRFPGKSSFER